MNKRDYSKVINKKSQELDQAILEYYGFMKNKNQIIKGKLIFTD